MKNIAAVAGRKTKLNSDTVCDLPALGALGLITRAVRKCEKHWSVVVVCVGWSSPVQTL